jgi:pimeloyl-ACP methyl ester carboxylesterase
VFDFKLQSNMIYTNTGFTLNTVEIDFGNGQGYQAVSLNTVKNVSYTSGGEKEMKVKFVYSGGPTLYSHARLYVDYTPPLAQYRFKSSDTSTQLITGAAWQGATATGHVTIETAGTDGVLDKPLIVVEGFDPFGSFDYNDLIEDENSGGINRIINEATGLTLNQAIEDEGYDLVFINYLNGTDFIQRNAQMVEAVVEWVNNNKTGTEKNVVLGMSMGGLVARYALRHMEQTSRVHDTKLYISHDAPQQGANVPLAYQAFVRHLVGESIGWPVFLSLFTINVVDIKDIVPALNDGMDLLQSPAAQQMLIYQLSGTGSGVSNTTNSLRTSFTTEYTSMGYPTQGGIRIIAISNGSECGTPLGFAPNANLVNVNEKIDLPWFTTNIVFTVLNAFSLNPIRTLTSFLSSNTDIKAEFNLRALPNQQAQQVYNGKIYIKKNVLGLINVEEQLINQKTVNATSTMLALDNAAGGVYDIERFITLPANMDDYLLETRFSFIPMFSSLDIGSGTQPIIATDIARAYSIVTPPLAPKNSPFQNFFTNPLISENHIQFMLNNGNWLMAELEGNPEQSSCNLLCVGTSIVPSIGAPPEVCSSGANVILNNVPLGSSVTWQASPANLFTNSSGSFSSSGNIVVLPLAAANGITNGSGTLTVNVNACGGSHQSISTFWVGVPSLTIPTVNTNPYYVNYPVCQGPNFLNVTPMGTNTIADWTVPSGISHIEGHNLLDFIMPSSPSTITISSQASNTCGNSKAFSFKLVKKTSGCNQAMMMAYPNPATDELVVTSNSKDDEAMIEVTLTDSNSQVVFTAKSFADKSVIIPIKNYKNGLYVLSIIENKVLEKQQVIISH